MNGYWQPVLILLVAAVSCQDGPKPLQPGGEAVQSATLDEGRSSTQFKIAKPAATMVLHITPAKTSADNAVIFKIYFDAATTPAQSIALFPPDQPGRFILSVPADATKIRVEAFDETKKPLPRFKLRLE
jgi:hypothetical protein